MNKYETTVLIVGAGPAGLATAALLSRQDIPYIIIEKSGAVGHSWREHYDRLCLHTAKALSSLPGLPFPEEYPQFVSKHQLVKYFEAYQKHFGIDPHFHTEARSIYRRGEKWVLENQRGDEYRADHLVVATGVNHAPNRPHFPGEEQFSGEISHSKTYKNGLPYAGKEVLVVGMGNTGAEIALDLVESGAASTTIAVRDAVNIVPLQLFGRPTQLTALKLAKLPNWLADWIGLQMRRLTMGDLRKYGLKLSRMAPMKQLRTTGKTPVVDLGTADLIRQGKIKIINAGIEHIGGREVVFSDGTCLSFDAIILATGYRARLVDLVQHCEEILDEYGWPRFVVGTGKWAGLHFIGYDNYTPGGILGVINRDAKLIADHISRRTGQPA